MNKFIREQLKHVEGVLLPAWNDSTTHLEIMHSNALPDVKVGGCYKIKLRIPVEKVEDTVLIVSVSKLVGEFMVVDARNETGAHNYQQLSIPLAIVKILEKY